MRIPWAVLAVAWLAIDAYLLLFQWPLVGGNVLAEVIIGTPPMYFALRRHIDHRHAEMHERLDAQDEALGIRPDRDA